MTEVLFFLVLTAGGNGITVVPQPFATEALCRAEAARVSRDAREGGLRGATAAGCVRVETPKREIK